MNSYRMLGAFMMIVSLWRMTGGGNGFLEKAKAKIASVYSVAEESVKAKSPEMRPVYPRDGGVVAKSILPDVSSNQSEEIEIMPSRETAEAYYKNWNTTDGCR
ncbi:MAG: hypothetical protein M0Z78_08935 [Betaproteobacteria bacterium]|nr:hypothetical protein [Betaproteobacteria bacterium]